MAATITAKPSWPHTMSCNFPTSRPLRVFWTAPAHTATTSNPLAWPKPYASKKYLLGLPRNAALEKTFAQLSRASIQAQREIEKADTGSFEEWRLRYMDVANLL